MRFVPRWALMAAVVDIGLPSSVPREHPSRYLACKSPVSKHRGDQHHVVLDDGDRSDGNFSHDHRCSSRGSLGGAGDSCLDLFVENAGEALSSLLAGFQWQFDYELRPDIDRTDSHCRVRLLRQCHHEPHSQATAATELEVRWQATAIVPNCNAGGLPVATGKADHDTTWLPLWIGVLGRIRSQLSYHQCDTDRPVGAHQDRLR